MIDWTLPYDAPLSLDSARLLGKRERRPTLWLCAAAIVLLPVALGNVMAVVFPPTSRSFPTWLGSLLIVMIPIAMIWAVVCWVFAKPWRQRQVEYWLGAWWRYVRLPKVQTNVHNHQDFSVHEHVLVSAHDQTFGAVIEVGTVNLTLRDSATLASFIGKLHKFYLGLKWPIQIVVRATPTDPIQRRWFIAITAETPALAAKRATDLVNALRRADLVGRQLNGDLYASLQECWSGKGSKLGPTQIAKERSHVKADSEYVRGFLQTRWPRTIDPNWLAPILDGDLAVDFSMWLDPIDNDDEAEMLNGRITEWQAAQILNQKNGWNDSDIDESIKDATLTRFMLRRTKIRVFRGSVGYVVRGATLEEMQDREQLLLDQLRETVGKEAVVPIDLEHDKAPMLAVPTGKPPVTYPLQIVSPAAAMTYVFSNSNVSMPGGIDVGRSIGSQRINHLNQFELAAPHMIIPGATGAGKGYWVKVYLWRLIRRTERVRAYIIQTEKNEYTALARALGSQGSVYEIRTLDDLASVEQPGNSHKILKTRRLALFDLTKMDVASKPAAIKALLGYIERTSAWLCPARAVCVIDELGIVLEDEASGQAIATAYRRFRSIEGYANEGYSRIGMIGMTQRVTDVLADKRGQILLASSDTRLYLKQKPDEMRKVKKMLELSDDEANFLETADEGEAILVAGMSHVALKLQATSEEESFAKT